jgi:FkbM family methyltransferase
MRRVTEPKLFVSYAQNAEDVVLWRALGHLSTGRYVEVGANDPVSDSISRSFYDRGWQGLEIEPVPAFAEEFGRQRPRDVVVQAAITSEPVDTVSLNVIDRSGLSTMDPAITERHAAQGWQYHEVQVPARRLDDVLAEHGFLDDVQFAVVDVEGAERTVLESVDLARWRPWVLVVEATSPLTSRPTHEEWEELVTSAGYRFCLFDGLSRFYVANEHSDVLADALSRPATVLDQYEPQRHVELRLENERLRSAVAALEEQQQELTREVIRWRGEVVASWAEALAEARELPYASPGSNLEAARLRAELEAIQQTVSWRVTRPLRTIRSAQRGVSR